MYSKTSAMLMLLGFCSGASNLQPKVQMISPGGTLENHATGISLKAGTSFAQHLYDTEGLKTTRWVTYASFGLSIISFVVAYFVHKSIKKNTDAKSIKTSSTALKICFVLMIPGVALTFIFGWVSFVARLQREESGFSIFIFSGRKTDRWWMMDFSLMIVVILGSIIAYSKGLAQGWIKDATKAEK